MVSVGTETKAFTPEDLVYGLKPIGAPAISPDGERIVYAVSPTDRESKKTTSHLWIQSRAGDDARQLTFSGKSNGSPVWSPDGDRIAFVSDRVKPDGQSGIFVMPAGGLGEAREVTRHIHGISGLTWSADGSKLAYCTLLDPDNPAEEKKGPDSLPQARATTRFDYKGDGRGWIGDVRNQVWVVDVESGQRRRLTSIPSDHADPAWSPDGKTIAAHVAREGNSWLVLIDVATAEQKQVGAADGQMGNYAWSPKGDRLFFTADPGHTYQADLYLYDVASGETKQLTDNPDIQPFTGMMGSGLAWLDDRTVLFSGARKAECGLYEIDVERGAIECLLSEPATRAGLSVDAAGHYVAQLRMAFDQPLEVTVFDIKEAHDSLASRHNAGLLSDHEPVGWERFSVEQGGLTTESWLLKPPGFDPTRRYPVIIDIHGGPNSFHASRFRPNDQLLASNGFVVVLPNPRGSTSFGRHFSVQVLGDRGGEDYKDLMAVADYVEKLPYVDPERIAIFGYSYGGFMTAWMLGQTNRFKACVCGAPSVDLESQFGTSDIGYIYDRTQYRARPWGKPEWFYEHSPVNFTNKATTPTMLVSGEADMRCPTSQAEQLFVSLKNAGCEVEFVRYPNSSHGFSSAGPAAYREDFLGRTLAWFQERVGDKD